MSFSGESPRSWTDVGFRLVLNAVSHPLEYAKVLIQIGYEPLPPYPSRTLFGKPAYALPNNFAYLGHIKKVDGFVGMYRGLTPKLCSQLIYITVYNSTMDSLNKKKDHQDKEDSTIAEKYEFRLFLRDLSKEIMARSACIVVSHPFYVISVRMMAQFVGRETKYNSIFSSIAEIYRENGLSGYFSGLVPRYLEEILSFLLTWGTTYLVCRYKSSDEEFKYYFSSVAGLVAKSITYPFLVVSTCMATTGSGLKAGSPPFMPLYQSSLECAFHLAKNNDIKRGSGIFWRYYSGPPVFNTPSGPVYLQPL